VFVGLPNVVDRDTSDVEECRSPRSFGDRLGV
jgi:hypothetical protein